MSSSHPSNSKINELSSVLVRPTCPYTIDVRALVADAGGDRRRRRTGRSRAAVRQRPGDAADERRVISEVRGVWSVLAYRSPGILHQSFKSCGRVARNIGSAREPDGGTARGIGD